MRGSECLTDGGAVQKRGRIVVLQTRQWPAGYGKRNQAQRRSVREHGVSDGFYM